jgi:RNA recognition motif-containing protein
MYLGFRVCSGLSVAVRIYLLDELMLSTTDNMEIFVGNLSFDISEEELQETFESFGVVSRMKIITDRDSGRSRGFAFVTMDSDEEAKAAIEDLDGKDVMGRALSVREATPRAPRGGGGGGGGGGNYRGGGGGGGNYRGGGGGGDYRGGR